MGFSGYKWKTSCCGIFCGPLEGGEFDSKISHRNRYRTEYPVAVMCASFEVSRSGYYDILRDIP